MAEINNLNIFRITIIAIAGVIIALTLLPELREYSDVFNNNKIINFLFIGVLDHIINIGNNLFSYSSIYNLLKRELTILREYLDDALIKNLIRYLISPAGAFIFFVPKKNGNLRLYVDYRALNKITVKN